MCVEKVDQYGQIPLCAEMCTGMTLVCVLSEAERW